MPLKIDLHVHSHYSYDSLITEKELVTYARKRGLDGVAVVDHNRIDGVLKIAKETDFFIMPGVEVTSADGHIVGLNVKETIPKGLGVHETIEKIHDAGGLAVACHPTAFFKGSLGKKANAPFDAVEVMNAAAVPFTYCAKRAQKLAFQLGLPQIAGSDAHYAPEIGYAYTLVESEPSVEKVVDAIRRGRCTPMGKGIPLTLRLKKALLIGWVF